MAGSIKKSEEVEITSTAGFVNFGNLVGKEVVIYLKENEGESGAIFGHYYGSILMNDNVFLKIGEDDNILYCVPLFNVAYMELKNEKEQVNMPIQIYKPGKREVPETVSSNYAPQSELFAGRRNVPENMLKTEEGDTVEIIGEEESINTKPKRTNPKNMP